MPKQSEAVAEMAVEPTANEDKGRLAEANERAAGFLLGAQKLMFEEFVFVGNELVERAQTEMHLFSELLSKMASAHSVKNIGSMCEECGKHQLDFLRRDCDRVFRHGARVIEATANLFRGHALN